MIRYTFPETTEELLNQLIQATEKKGETIATAESCTGGLLATLFTHFPGSSSVYLGGVSSYANQAKISLLGVSPATLENEGAVSKACAMEMAKGIKKALNSTYSLAITGIAGPSGATPEKPVGTIWVGTAHPHGVHARLFHLKGTRNEIREQISYLALVELTGYTKDQANGRG